VPQGQFASPLFDAVQRFVDALEALGLQVNLRRRRGADIDAACGQLRRRAEA